MELPNHDELDLIDGFPLEWLAHYANQQLITTSDPTQYQDNAHLTLGSFSAYYDGSCGQSSSSMIMGPDPAAAAAGSAPAGGGQFCIASDPAFNCINEQLITASNSAYAGNGQLIMEFNSGFLDKSAHFLETEGLWCDIASHSPMLSGDLEGTPSFSGQFSLGYVEFDGMATDSADILTVENVEEEQVEARNPGQSSAYEVATRNNKGSKKRARSDAFSTSFQHKRGKISSPQSVLDEAEEGEMGKKSAHYRKHPINANSKEFATNQWQLKREELDEPCSQTSSPRKQLKKGPSSHSNAHHPSKESKWAQQLLKSCASAIACNNISRTQHLMWVLNDLSSFSGDSNQRLAACGLKALFSRVTGKVSMPPTLPLAPDPTNSHSTALPIHRALLKFQDASPWHKSIYTIANGAILEACEGHEVIHVVDIGVSQGTQWPTLIEALATRAWGAPKLMRLTMVQNVLGCANFAARLEPFAKKLGLKLELKIITSPLESLDRKDLELAKGEVLIICMQFRLHHLNYEVSRGEACNKSSKRDKFIQFIHSLNPNTFILSENDIDHCSPDFLVRFQRAMEFHWIFLDAISAAFQGQESEERHIMETDAALAFTNIVAYEGDSRIERNETHRAWSCRARRAGFSSHLPGAQVLESAKSLLRKHSGDWNMLVEDGTMVLRWKGNPTTFCSLWKPFSI